MGKTEKEKAKEKEKGKDKDKKKDKVPKILKAGAGGDKTKKKKWSKSKSKEKLNNAVFWTKPVWDKMLKEVIGKEAYVTPSLISEKLKINVSLAREAIRALRDENKLAPSTEFHSKYCCFVKTPQFILAAPAEKKEAGPAKGEQKKGKDKGEKGDKREKGEKEDKGEKVETK